MHGLGFRGLGILVGYAALHKRMLRVVIYASCPGCGGRQRSLSWLYFPLNSAGHIPKPSKPIGVELLSNSTLVRTPKSRDLYSTVAIL